MPTFASAFICMENLLAFKACLQRATKTVIVAHFRPDADALGSSLGLCHYLRKKNISSEVITPSPYPSFLAWMPGHESVFAVRPDNATDREEARKRIEGADFIFCIDFSNLSRAHALGELIRQAPAKKAMIDHHLDPGSFADFMQWDARAASTAGLVFDLIEQLGDRDSIDADIANCLYAGLMTDTGGFRHSNTTRREFLIAADLVGAGADPAYVSKMIYDSNTLDKLRFMGFVLQNKIKLLPQYHTAYIALHHDDFSQFNVQMGDTEGLVNYGLSITGVQLSVLAYTSRTEIKLSFRSLGNFPANEIAKAHFNGGGHKNAAGGTSHESLEATIQRLTAILPQYQRYFNTVS